MGDTGATWAPSSADISQDGKYRWRLERRWGPGGYVCWVMCNPSTADAMDDDPTILRVKAFSKRWGYDAAVVVNLWPFRTPDPMACRDWAAGEGLLGSVQTRRGYPEAMLRNASAVWQAASRTDLTIVAWGAGGWFLPYAKDMKTALRLQNVELHCLGMNSGGSPRHPMARGAGRVPDDQEPVLFLN